MTVKAIAEVPVEQQAAAVVIAPDGKRAFVCLNLANRIGVLSIDGEKVTYDKSLDIPSAFNPYNIDLRLMANTSLPQTPLQGRTTPMPR